MMVCCGIITYQCPNIAVVFAHSRYAMLRVDVKLHPTLSVAPFTNMV